MRGAHGGYGFTALLRVVLDAEVSSSVLTAESQTLRLNGPELIACLVRALQLDPLKFVGLRVAMAKSRGARLGSGQAESGSACVLLDETGGCRESSVPAPLRDETDRVAAGTGAENEVGLTSRIFRLGLALGQRVFPFPGGAAIVAVTSGAAAAPTPQSSKSPTSAVPRQARLPEGPS